MKSFRIACKHDLINTTVARWECQIETLFDPEKDF